MTTARDTTSEISNRAEPPRSYSPPLAPEPEPVLKQKIGIRLTEQQLRARRSRSLAIALALGAFVLVIFAVTIVRLGSGVLTGPDYMRPVQTSK
jgi:hypothetical protein